MNESNQKPDGTCPPQKTLCSTLSVACICIAAVLIVYRVVTPKSEAGRRLWTPIVIETNGGQTILGETRQMEFWTPSARTKDYLKTENTSVRDKEKWQVIPSDDVVFKFGESLHTNAYVLGYRRVEEWGHGHTGFKPGWWWAVTVTTTCDAGEMAKAYQKFWNPPSPVLIEVIDNRGSDK